MRPTIGRRFAVAASCALVAIALPAIALALRGSSASPASTSATGIGAVSSSRETALDAASASTERMLNARGFLTATAGARLLSEARTVPVTVAGSRLYLVPTEKGKLCLFLEVYGETCSDPIGAANPALIVAEDRDGPGGAGPLVYGVAMDGVSSVTFELGGRRATVHVAQNTFVYRGDSAASAGTLLPVSASFADGSSTPLD
jgi:hypothetical protein